MSSHKKRYPSTLKKFLRVLINTPKSYWQGGLLHKLISIVIILVLLLISSMYGIARWYIYSGRNIPMSYGVTFIPDYAQSLGVNPKQNMQALLNIGVRQFRLVSYWSDIEPSQGSYDFSQLDWEFKLANKYHAKIILSIGLRQPRWPECHPPSWVDTSKPLNSWQPELLSYMNKVILRYKGNPSLQAWQLENEYFLKGFGDCNNFSRQRLVTEYNLLSAMDPHHTIILGRSNNALGTPLGKPVPDMYSISIYKRVWDAAVTHRYLEYPFPAWFYGFLAGVQEMTQGKNMIIAELQGEAWPPDGQSITQTPLSEQNKSMNAHRLKDRFNFARATGMKDALLWGSEYWYYRLTVLHDPSLWNVAKQEFSANNQNNGQYLFKQP